MLSYHTPRLLMERRMVLDGICRQFAVNVGKSVKNINCKMSKLFTDHLFPRPCKEEKACA